jgi:hypothetical protein
VCPARPSVCFVLSKSILILLFLFLTPHTHSPPLPSATRVPKDKILSESFCFLCGDGGDLVCCQNCPKVCAAYFHFIIDLMPHDVITRSFSFGIFNYPSLSSACFNLPALSHLLCFPFSRSTTSSVSASASAARDSTTPPRSAPSSVRGTSAGRAASASRRRAACSSAAPTARPPTALTACRTIARRRTRRRSRLPISPSM